MPQLLLLAVLVCCSILCKPLLAIEECPCWELNPDPGTGECIDGYLPLVYSSREFLETYTQCVDRVTYDADYGALVASLCWNKDCLPERFQDQTVLVELNLGEEELADMTEGNYTSTFEGEPSQNGIRLRTSVSAFEQFEQGVERVSVRGDNATFTVPEGGLTRLKIEWEWPNQLNAPEAGSNQAFVIIRNSSLSEVPLTWPGLQSPVDAHSLSNLDLCEPVQAVGEDTEGASCDKGKVALRVMRTPDFEGVSGVVIEFEEEDVAALMCVDPPKYDKYTQLLEWGFAWDYDCWEPAPEYTEATVFRMEEVPSVEGSERNGLDGLGIPSNAQIQLMTRAEQIYATVGEGEDSKQAMVPYFSVRKVNEPHFDGLGGFDSDKVPSDNFTFSLPEEGMFAFTLDTKLFPIPDGDSTLGQVRYMGLVSPQAPDEDADPGQVRVDMDDSPLKMKDKHTIIDYNATLAIKGQHFNDLKPWITMLGVRASVQAVGWGITVPVLLRNSSVLSSCDVDDVDAFLVRLANGTNIERSHLNASCVELPPGQAIGYAEQLLKYTTEPAYLRGPPGLQNVAVPNVGGQPTLNRCSDARYGLNITYNYLLPPEDRPEPVHVQDDFTGDSSSSSGGNPAAAAFSARAKKAKSSHTKGAAKVDPAKMPKVHPLTEEEGKKRRALLQDDNILSSPLDILMELQQAAQNMSSLFMDDIGFRDEKFGGSQQYCVHPRGVVSTLVSVEDSILRAKKVAEEGGIPVLPREGRRFIIGNQTKMRRICTSTIEAAVERLEVFLGQERPVNVDFLQLTGCYGETNCIDCWPYEVLEIYQIVLIVCAFCLSVIAILGVRAYMVMKVDSMTKTLRPGYLNDEGTIERLIREQEELDYDDIVD